MGRIYLETYGCTLNRADSQAIQGVLEQAGFKFVGLPERSDLIILNTCTVKSPTENKILKRIRELKKLGRPIVIAGCLPQAEPNKKELKGLGQMGVFQIPNAVQIIEEALNDNPITALAKQDYDRLAVPSFSPNNIVEIIPICQGCLGAPCTYCLVKKARGPLMSYKPEAIIDKVKASCAKEIYLTAQDTAAYGLDIGTNLIELLKKIIAIPKNFKIRLGMGNPNHFKDQIDGLVEVFKDSKMFKFIHLPVQAGNNEVLKAMKRRYTVEEFKEIVTRLRTAIPKITIATDIICGFPGETKAQFQDSLDLVSEVKPEIVNISRFWPRPGTPAAKMKYSGSTTKNRSRQMTELFLKVGFKQNLQWIGWKGHIIIDEKGPDEYWVGHNSSYKQVIIQNEGNLLGQIVKVRVFDVTAHDLRAKILL